MNKFFDDYFNFKKMVKEKQVYRQKMKQVKQLPEDYQFVFEKIQANLWKFVSGAGYDMLQIQYGLIDLFMEGAAEGKDVLEITGDDVGAFCEELLRSASTYTANWHSKMNEEIHKKLRR